MGFLKTKAKPGDVARDRLKFVLIHDRSNCSPKLLEKMKLDIVKVISKYMLVDEQSMDIQIMHSDSNDSDIPVLFANVPVMSIRKEPH
ncbi:MAG: cell division topological specificity factor MinE [Turicibacter sp.]|nr:cell division topological specificity factor MinE [Turicibacter sp.]